MKKIQAKLSEWRKKSLADLIKEIKKMEDNLAKERVNVSLQKQKDLSVLSKTRRDIARLKCLIAEKRS